MTVFLANGMQWSSTNFNSQTSTNDKFWFAEANALVRPKFHQIQKRAPMLSTMGAIPQEQAV